MRWRISKLQDVVARSSYFPYLDHIEDQRIVSSADWTISVGLFEGLGFRAGARHEYDGRADDEDDKHDFRYFGNITYDF